MRDSIKIQILNHLSEKSEYQIPYASQLRGIHISVFSGDHLIIPVYNTGINSEAIETTLRHDKKDVKYEGGVFIKKCNIKDYNKLTNTYDIFNADWAQVIWDYRED